MLLAALYTMSWKSMFTCARRVLHCDALQESIIYEIHQVTYVPSVTCPRGSLLKLLVTISAVLSM
jgi:hypothetical protein